MKKPPRRSHPYHCPACFHEPKCGFYGLLVREGDPIPTCDHHHNPVTMVPAHGGAREAAV